MRTHIQQHSHKGAWILRTPPPQLIYSICSSTHIRELQNVGHYPPPNSVLKQKKCRSLPPQLSALASLQQIDLRSLSLSLSSSLSLSLSLVSSLPPSLHGGRTLLYLWMEGRNVCSLSILVQSGHHAYLHFCPHTTHTTGVISWARCPTAYTCVRIPTHVLIPTHVSSYHAYYRCNLLSSLPDCFSAMQKLKELVPDKKA